MKFRVSRVFGVVAVAVVVIGLLPGSNAAVCEFLPPKMDRSTANGDEEFGLIMIPGSRIPGEKYKPLADKIQEIFPGKLWIGVTEGWLVDMPNPFEVEAAIFACFEAASTQGSSTNRVFMSGHSLGGIVLETYIRDHPEYSSGIILFGSYLADGFVGPDDNVFPVPALTAVGTLDGGVLSYVLREWKESQIVDETLPDKKGNYPVILVDRVNHAQVASGVEPEKPSLRFEDIEAEVSESEAHIRYATAAVAFIVNQMPAAFDEATAQVWAEEFNGMIDFTKDFLEPFNQMSQLELDQGEGGQQKSPWVVTSQKLLLRRDDVDQLGLAVESSVVSFFDLPGLKPNLNSSECVANIQTYSHNQYPSSPLDVDVLLSADVIKAKMKLEDVVLSEGLCQTVGQRSQCKDLNQAAYDLAISVASEEAIQRLVNKGRQLSFVDDDVASTGLGWVASGGLKYNKVSDSLVELQSVALLTEPDVMFEDLAGMHYCDLLSPYRALEWIYIGGVIRL